MIYRLTPHHERLIALAVFVLCALYILTGCSSSRPVVEQETAVVTTRPDTTLRRDAPPIPREGRATMPTGVEIYQRPDTTSPVISDLVAVTIDRSQGGQGTVTVQTRTGSTTFRNAAEGQIETFRADSTGAVVASVTGKVKPTYAPEKETPVWDTLARFGLGVLILLGFAVGAWFALRR